MCEIHSIGIFNRFGEDLSANILSYLNLDYQEKLIFVSKQWYKEMFSMSHFATVDCEEALMSDDCVNPFEKTQYRRVWRMVARVNEFSFFLLPNIIKSAPNLKELKIEWDSSEYNTPLNECQVLILKECIKNSNVTKLHLAITVSFNNYENLNQFIQEFSEMLYEIWIDLSKSYNKEPYSMLLHNINSMKCLKKLALLNVKTNSTTDLLIFLSKDVPNLEVIMIFGNDIRNIDTCWPLNLLIKYFKNIKYFLLRLFH